MYRYKPFISYLLLFLLLLVSIFFIDKGETLEQEFNIIQSTKINISETTTQTMSHAGNIESPSHVILPTNQPEFFAKETVFLTPTIPLLTEVKDAKESLEDTLYLASQKFIAETPEEAILIARKIDFLAGEFEEACNMCGPLSIAILKEAGLLPLETDVHKAWLLCARENREDCSGIETLKKNFFPPDQYEYRFVNESVKDYDFKSDPLLPGDWLYLYTYIHGYDHMLVVTKVDEDGNPYTVTNVDWGDGFIISEFKLYDTENPEEGLFYEMTKIERRRIGMMGTMGFLLVRKIGGIS